MVFHLNGVYPPVGHLSYECPALCPLPKSSKGGNGGKGKGGKGKGGKDGKDCQLKSRNYGLPGQPRRWCGTCANKNGGTL